MITWYS
jgi:hypothetical protein